MMTSEKSKIKNCLGPAVFLIGLALFCASCASKVLKTVIEEPSLYAEDLPDVEELMPRYEDSLVKNASFCKEQGIRNFFHRSKSAKICINDSVSNSSIVCPYPMGLPLIKNWQSNNRQPSEKATAWICYDREFFCFYVVLEDSNITTRATENDQKFWDLGDTIEFFIKPRVSEEQYYEIHVSPNGLITDIYIPSREKMRMGKVSWSEKIAYDSKSDREVVVFAEEAKWAVKLCLPWEGFGLKQTSEPGSIWSFAVCRRNYWSDEKGSELSSTAYLRVLDFHRYEDYHSVIF